MLYFHERVSDTSITLSSPAISRRDSRAGDLPPGREVDVLRRALALVEQRLPAGWTLAIEEEVRLGDLRVDALVELQAPDGSRTVLMVEVKRELATRDVANILEQLELASERLDRPVRAQPMVIARYLSASTRERLEQRGAAYADATGNLRIVLERPALFLRDTGAQRDLWRGPGRPRGSLKGSPAARVVRALVDFAPPFTVPELVQRSGASTGATYRVVEFLEQEALIERQPRGQITTADWRALLERWSEDYGFQASNTVVSYLAPRGLSTLAEALRGTPELRYVLTGSLAAERFAPYAPSRLAAVYVDRLDQVAERLDLREVDTGANVLLATSDYDVVFERSQDIDGLRLAAPSQVAADLLTAPGRGPTEAQALLDWMEANEPAWRR
jgi:hypothetical protein